MTPEELLAQEALLRHRARRTLRNEHDVEDCVQTALLKAWRARGAFRPGTSVQAWLTTILQRVVINHVRAGRHRHTEELLEEPPARRPAAAAGAGEISTRMRAAVAALSPQLREAFLLQVLEGLTGREIAARLSVPPATVFSRVRRARDRLRFSLREGAPAPDSKRGLRGS